MGVDGFDKKGLRRLEGQFIMKEKKRQLKLDMVFVIKENTHRFFFLTVFPIWPNNLVICKDGSCVVFVQKILCKVLMLKYIKQKLIVKGNAKKI